MNECVRVATNAYKLRNNLLEHEAVIRVCYLFDIEFKCCTFPPPGHSASMQFATFTGTVGGALARTIGKIGAAAGKIGIMDKKCSDFVRGPDGGM